MMGENKYYLIKFRYLKSQQQGRGDVCDFKTTVQAKDYRDAEDQAEKIAIKQNKPMYVFGIERLVSQRTYGNEACFVFEQGCKLMVQYIAYTRTAEYLLTLQGEKDEQLAIVMDDEAKQQLLKWLQIDRNEKGGQPKINRAKSPNQTVGRKARKEGVLCVK